MSDEEQPVRPQRAPSEEPRPRVRAVVAVGASAGGLTALRAFFDTVPADTGLAFVVVVHLPLRGESHLADLLQPHARIPIEQVTGTMTLEPNHAYVIPPGQNLTAVDSHLRLTPIEAERRAPVDHFFRTLAETHDGHSVGVILSGTGTDGGEGARYIRARGGMVIVQDPDEAQYDGMPRNAILHGVVDVVAPVAEMVGHIQAFVGTHPRVVADARPAADANRAEVERADADRADADRADADRANADRATVERAGAERADVQLADPLQSALALVRLHTGHDFLRYKRSTVARRVARRMQILGVEQIQDYLEVLREGPQEAAALLDDLLINVTSFFRDPDVFRTLESEVIPKLFDGKGPRDRVRVWSMGCSTGEEAYSLAMLLLEEAERREGGPQVQVFASDLHDRSLRHAREGVYPDAIAEDVPPDRLDRFFRHEDGTYRVRKELRDVVVFATHNLLQDPPFSRLDLIVCRNVLIYLQGDAQRDIVEIFHYALRGSGYLLLGTAETLDRPELFRLEHRESHLYRRRDVPRGELRLPPPFPLSSALAPYAPLASRVPPASSVPRYGAVHQTLLERYAPPSLVVGPEDDVVHLSESAGRYLLYPGGVPTTNVFKLVREELRTELRAALHGAREGRWTRRTRPIPVSIDGRTKHVVLRVSPAAEPELEGLALVVFDEVSEPPEAAAPSSPGGESGDAAVRELEAELELTRSQLQTVLEESESSREEMRASNEELQSANEELRSTMEELETSREELQSVNEELQTLNQENKHKVAELTLLSNDLQNLLQATDVATIFLDRNLRILRFTPSVGQIFSVRPSDRGRPLEDLTHRLGYLGLIEDVRVVLETLIPVEREVESQDRSRWYVVRVTPYRTMEDRIEGAVITLVDVTALKGSELAVREAAVLARSDVARDELRRQLASAEEGERRRLARELHDEVGQHLTALGLGLQALSDVSPPDSEVDRRAVELRRLVDIMGRELHEIAVRLRPKALDDFGLEAAIGGYAEQWSRQAGIAVEIHARSEAERLPPEIEITVYRIVQEALTNVAKHSGATRAGVVIERQDGNVHAIVEDNGRGFDPTSSTRRRRSLDGRAGGAALGLLGIRERVALLGGKVDVESTPGGGTTLFVRIPIVVPGGV